MTKIPVIFDCDPGIDDAFAIMLAVANRDVLDIKCISTVGGNQILEKTTKNALQLMEFFGIDDIPVVAGMAKPLIKPQMIAEYVHGETGMGRNNLPEPTMQASERHVLDIFAEILENSDQKVTFLVTGPQTNMALFLTARPDLHHKIKEIVFMGGACFLGNVTPYSEFNIYVDPEAARIVADSGIPQVMFGLDVTHRAYLKPEEIQIFRGIGNKTGYLMAELLEFYAAESEAEFLHESDGIRIHMHDVTTVMYLLKPDLFSLRELYVHVRSDDEGAFRGTTVVDYNNKFKKPANMQVCFDVKREQFIAKLASEIKKLP